jgi:eukaryotic-like serine/threonine-protein kinase
VTFVDVNESFLASAGDTLTLARNIAVASVLVPYGCVECDRTSYESVPAAWPMQFGAQVCARCGGNTGNKLSVDKLLPLQKASTNIPLASAKVVGGREEILSRALIDASVAQAGDSAAAQVTTDDAILGKYKIVRKLSVGGMAEVFLAKQVGIGGFEKLVALKRIQRELLEARHRAIELFLNEAKIAGRLTHPNIVQVLDVGEVQGALYLAMEYVHGKDLRKVIKQLRHNHAVMPLGEALHIVREIAQALHHAYWSTDITGQRLAVVHRDVSPHNIILSYDGAVKLLDFGVAMSAVTEHAEDMIVGKWLYMSPETTTTKQVDHRSDLFSLGVILYLLCSGYLPFTGREPKDIVRKIRAGQYKPLQELASVPDRLVTLLNRLLAPNPDDRPQRGQDVAVELADIARQYGLSGSSPGIAYVLSQLFPSEMAGGLESQGTGRGTVRLVAEEGSGSVTKLEKSPASVTPGSGSNSSSNRRLVPLDVSVTYRRRTGELSVPDEPELSTSPPLGPAAAAAPPGGEPRASHAARDRVATVAAKLPPGPRGIGLVGRARGRSVTLVLIAVPFAVALALVAYFLYGR